MVWCLKHTGQNSITYTCQCKSNRIKSQSQNKIQQPYRVSEMLDVSCLENEWKLVDSRYLHASESSKILFKTLNFIYFNKPCCLFCFTGLNIYTSSPSQRVQRLWYNPVGVFFLCLTSSLWVSEFLMLSVLHCLCLTASILFLFSLDFGIIFFCCHQFRLCKALTFFISAKPGVV